MKVLFCGDIVGRAGRDVVVNELPALRRNLKVDFVVANAENAAHGFGMTEKICNELFEAGVDVITGGNHTWDKAEIIPVMERDKRILRPMNFPAGTPGRGVGAFTDGRGRRILVVNIMARLFMELLDDPFQSIQDALPLGAPKHGGYEAVLIDLHGEATSEKMAFGHMVDGRATLVVGTHTHVPTADTVILERRLLDHLEGQRAVGGWIRDDLSIEHREVKISLSCFDDGVGDTPLITLLTACLISVEQANPMLNGDEIDFDLA